MILEKPVIQEVGYKTYVINCFGMQTPMLFVGEEKALLIDSGCGNYDLKGQIEEFVDVPVICAVSHEHADHVGGIVQFEHVYAPEKEIATIRSYTTGFMQRFLDYYLSVVTGEDGYAGCFAPGRHVLSWERIPEISPIRDGDVFELGGRTVTAWHCPVHSKGHMVFVDDLSRILYSGDSISYGAGPANNPINPPTIVSLEGEINALKRIKKYAHSFDRVFSGHPEGDSPVVSVSISPQVIDRMLEVGEAVLEGNLAIYTENGICGLRNYSKKGQTTLYYFKEYLWEKDLLDKYR